jgi:enoyl-[acyl-carrier protein] reductase II
MSQDEMVDEIRAVKAAMSKPFGVDLLTALPEQMMSNIELVIREGAQVFVAGLGVPRDAIKLCHDNNVLVVNMCGKVRHAIAAVEAGCDLVVAGHRRRPYRHRRHDAARAADRRRGRRPGAGGGGGGSRP